MDTSHGPDVTTQNNVRSVERSAALLSVLAERPDSPLGVISQAAGIHPASARRLLLTLERLGLVHQSADTRRYWLGPKLLYLGGRAIAQFPFHEVARRHMKSLADATQESVYLAVLQGHDVLYVDVITSTQSIRMSTDVGYRCPAFSTATGRVLLSYLEHDQLEAAIGAERPPQTPFTITDHDELIQLVARAHKDGYSISVDEQEVGVTSVAAPVFGHNGTPIAALAVAGPTFRMTADKHMNIVQSVIECAGRVGDGMRPTLGRGK